MYLSKNVNIKKTLRRPQFEKVGVKKCQFIHKLEIPCTILVFKYVLLKQKFQYFANVLTI